jgi:predicted nuclease of predicted toxin-antitoxin system
MHNAHHKAHVHVGTGWAFMGTFLLLRMTDLADHQGHSYQPIVSSQWHHRPPRQRSLKLNNDTTTTNAAPDDNDDIVMNENDFHDALVGIGHPPSINNNNVDNSNNNKSVSMTFIQQYLGQIITTLLSMIIALIVFVLLPMYAVQAAKSSRWDHTLYLICGVFVLIADWIMNMMYQMACKTFCCLWDM